MNSTKDWYITLAFMHSQGYSTVEE